jgi:hypothetical protein
MDEGDDRWSAAVQSHGLRRVGASDAANDHARSGAGEWVRRRV